MQDTVGRKPAKKAQQRKPTRPKRGNAARAARPASSTLTDLQEQVSALTRELAEARKQQTATSDVLKVISSSSGELEPVFQAMLENATRLCAAHFGSLWRFETGAVTLVSNFNHPPAFAEFLQKGPHRPSQHNPITRVIKTSQALHIVTIVPMKPISITTHWQSPASKSAESGLCSSCR
jgi:hypothetical protein